MLTERNVLEFGDSRLEQAAYPAAALPIIAFEDRIQMHFNGERVDLAHFGPAHTAGDAAVFFRGRNVVHLGDVLIGSYPIADADERAAPAAERLRTATRASNLPGTSSQR
jgi:cyclase